MLLIWELEIFTSVGKVELKVGKSNQVASECLSILLY